MQSCAPALLADERVMRPAQTDSVSVPSTLNDRCHVQNQAAQQNVYGNIYYASNPHVLGHNAGSESSIKSLDDSILTSLAFPQMLDRRSNVESPYKQTCQWIAQLETYKTWKASTSGLLWIKGKPGAGKSTLMSHLYRDIDISNTVHENLGNIIRLEFFFSARGVQLQRSILGMLRSLLNQIFNQDPSIRPLVRGLFEEKRASFGTGALTWDWQRPELEDLLTHAMVTSARQRPIVLLIDALDEAGEETARVIARYFHNINDQAIMQSLLLKICMSCRHYPIPSNIPSIEIYVEDHNRDDIISYIRGYINIETLSSTDADDHEEWQALVQLLVDQARGVFQWVRLVIPMVEKSMGDGDTPQRIRRWLQQVPEQLEHVYKHVLKAVIGHKYRQNALQMFQWVCLAERPLSVTELRYALAASKIAKSRNPVDCHQANDFVQTDLSMRSSVKAWSGGLLEVISSTESSDEVVQVIHQSVNEFLLSQGLQFLATLVTGDDETQCTGNVASQKSQLVESLHGELYWSCMTYISTPEVQTFLRSKEKFSYYHKAYKLEKVVSQSLPFIRYSTLNVLKHAQRAGTRRNQDLENELKMLRYIMHGWIAIWNALESGVRNRLEVGTTVLHMAAAANRRDLILYLSERRIAIDAVDSLGRTALHIAATWGHTTVAKLLVILGADLQKQTKDGDTPLILAAGRGHIELFSWLLSQGACLANGSETALYAAAFSGNTTIVRLCIEAGAEVDACGGCFGTALQAASATGHESVARLLIQSGANVNIRAGYYGSPLRTARAYKHRSIEILLEDAGAESDA